MLLYSLYDRAIGQGFRSDWPLQGSPLHFGFSSALAHPTGIRALDYGVIASLVCLAAVTHRPDVHPLDWEVSRWLRDISYSLYLSHPFIVAGAMLVLSQALSPFRDRPYLRWFLN
jgi:peptidoglycan/LPS O-acetylase OafA/YrhL